MTGITSLNLCDYWNPENPMSHDLDESTGRPAMAYVGAAPWHGLGEQLPEGQPIEKWLEAARLQWKIQMLPVHYPFQGQERTMDGRFVLARDDTGSALSIVSSDYKIVKASEESVRVRKASGSGLAIKSVRVRSCNHKSVRVKKASGSKASGS